MERKKTESRTPAPIFTIKRPRQALLAHPGNSFVADENAHRGHGFTSSVKTRMPQQSVLKCKTAFNEVENTLPPLSQPLPMTFAHPLPPALSDSYSINSRVSRSFGTTGLNSSQQSFRNKSTWSPSNLPITSDYRQQFVSKQPVNSKCFTNAVSRPLMLPVSSSSINVSPVSRTTFNTHQNNSVRSTVQASAPSMCLTSSSGFNSFNQHNHIGSNSSSQQLQRHGGGIEQQGMMWDKQQSISDPSLVFLKQDKQHCVPSVNNNETKLITPASPMFNNETKPSMFTMRFVTSSVEGLKHWSECKIKLPVMFEVIGMLNSAIAGDLMNNACLTFLLKDLTGCVNCTFYQIDRQLPRLTRGQWYRCVGHYDATTTSNSSFKCVSVRLASEAEKRHRETLIATSCRALQEWMHSISET